ncbi:MAG: response regulator transcription factor [Ignavibacteriaceae bacterium]
MKFRSTEFMEDNIIKILIADDHSEMRNGITELVAGEKSFSVVGHAKDGNDLISKYPLLMPDVLIVDISMPLLSGMEAVKLLKKDYPDVKALFLSLYDSEEYAYYCIKAGGLGLVSKNLTRDEIIEGIKTVNQNKYFFGHQIDYSEIENIVKKYEPTDDKFRNIELFNLTFKEKKYLEFINEGMTTKEIENELQINPVKLGKLRSKLMKKLGLRSLPELVKFAVSYFINK